MHYLINAVPVETEMIIRVKRTRQHIPLEWITPKPLIFRAVSLGIRVRRPACSRYFPSWTPGTRVFRFSFGRLPNFVTQCELCHLWDSIRESRPVIEILSDFGTETYGMLVSALRQDSVQFPDQKLQMYVWLMKFLHFPRPRVGCFIFPN